MKNVKRKKNTRQINWKKRETQTRRKKKNVKRINNAKKTTEKKNAQTRTITQRTTL